MGSINISVDRIISHDTKWLPSWRIQAKENRQNTPDGSDIDLLSGINNTVVTLSEQEDTRRVDCKIYEPLVLEEKTQHWK